MPLVLVACSGPKLAVAAPARDLYVSPLFKKARAFAELYGSDWLILSARHGVLRPDKIVEPYDQRMPTRKKDRAAWVRLVRSAMYEHFDRRIVALCGSDYLGWTSEFIGFEDDAAGRAVPRYANVYNVERPLEGMGIGRQLKFLTRAE